MLYLIYGVLVPRGLKSTLIFAVDIQHIEDLTLHFKAQGINAMGIHSKTPIHERKGILELFRDGKIAVLINCGIFFFAASFQCLNVIQCIGILTEGVDMPRVDCILLARPTKSSILLQQMIGRGLRLFQGI